MDPILGEIKLLPYTKVPKNWHLCDGTLLQVNSYKALFALIYNTYGGDGKTTFALPDLRSRVLMGVKFGSYNMASTGGVEQVTLTAANLPAHLHAMQVSSSAGNLNAVGTTAIYSSVAVGNPQQNIYGAVPTDQSKIVAIDPSSVNGVGGAGGAPHSNIQPSLGLEYCIAINGLWPARA